MLDPNTDSKKLIEIEKKKVCTAFKEFFLQSGNYVISSDVIGTKERNI